MTATAPARRSGVRGLRKSYGKQVVLDGIDLDVAEGTVFALLGPNGAGKTTTVHILSTLIAADAGEVASPATTSRASRTRSAAVIGVTGQVSAVDEQFTGEENLRLMADLCHLGRDEGRRGSRSCSSVRARPTTPPSRRNDTRAGCSAASTWR